MNNGFSPDAVPVSAPSGLDLVEQMIARTPWSKQAEIKPGTTDGRFQSHIVELRLRPRFRELLFVAFCGARARLTQIAELEEFFEKCPRRAIPVVAAGRISAAMAQEFTARRWGCMDAVGNCHIVASTLYIEVRGRAGAGISGSSIGASRRTVSLTSDATSRVVQTLLSPRSLRKRWSCRDLIGSCGGKISIGHIHNFFRTFANVGYLEKLPDQKGFQLKRPDELLDEWSSAIISKVDQPVSHFHANLSTFRARFPKDENTVLTGLPALKWHIGASEDAIFSETIHLRSSVAPEVFAERVGAKPVERDGNLIMLHSRPEDAALTESRTIASGIRIASAIQTYLDLMILGDLAGISATTFRESYLKPNFSKCGL